MRKKRSILLITTGGTFGMLPGARGFLASVERAVPEIRAIAQLKVRSPFALDSASLTPDHWLVLARLIASEIDQFDGFVITHGTDTMAYTAAALSYLLEGLQKPVILTGAQRPLAEIRTDARTNLIDAVEVATLGLPEVAICFGGVILRGNRAHKWSLSDYRAFSSPNYPPLAEAGTSLVVHWPNVLRRSTRFRLRDALDARVLHLTLAPGLFGSGLIGLDFSRVRGVVLQTFGAGNVPLRDGKEAFPLTRLCELGIPVFVVSGPEHGAVDFSLYGGGRHAAKAGAISAGDMTSEAAVAKLMVALGRSRGPRDLRRMLEADWAGEVTTS